MSNKISRVIYDVINISSGTMCTIIRRDILDGLHNLKKIDYIHNKFVEFCIKNYSDESIGNNLFWNKAWDDFIKGNKEQIIKYLT